MKKMEPQGNRIEILDFEKFKDIPWSIRKRVRNMHYLIGSHIDNAIKHDTIKGCHVLLVDGIPVGWYARYNIMERSWADGVVRKQRVEFGFWIMHKYRNRGYGRLLIAHSVEKYAGVRTKYLGSADWFRDSISNDARRTKVKMTALARKILSESKVCMV